MTQAVFQRRIELGRSHSQPAQPEVRVVAEATRTAGRCHNGAFPYALGGQRRGVLRVAHQHEHTAIARGPPLRTVPRVEFRQARDEFGVIRGIVGARAREACRMHTRGAAESIDFESGVIGNRRTTARDRSVARLQYSILEEGCAGLLGRGKSKFAKARQIEGCISQQMAKFGELTGIGAGDDETLMLRGH